MSIASLGSGASASRYKAARLKRSQAGHTYICAARARAGFLELTRTPACKLPLKFTRHGLAGGSSESAMRVGMAMFSPLIIYVCGIPETAWRPKYKIFPRGAGSFKVLGMGLQS